MNNQDGTGEKVIVRSNDNEPACVGTLVRWQTFPGSGDIPIVDVEGQKMLVMGVLLPYHEGLLDLLNSMTPKEAWNLAKDISQLCQVRARRMFLKR